MSNDKVREHESLDSVARWRALELEDARLEHAVADRALAEQKRLRAEVSARLEDSRNFEHAASSQGVSAAALRHAHAYTEWQARELERQQRRVTDAERVVSEARALVVQRFQALRAIDRLRERRVRHGAIDAARTQQKLLDEHALLRVARDYSNPEHQPWPSMRSE